MEYSDLSKIAESGDADALLKELAQQYEDAGQYALLFEALIVGQRFALGLPVVGDLSTLDEKDPRRVALEAQYSDTCRRVGELFLSDGDVGQAFAYFRTLQEPEPIRDALRTWSKLPREEREPRLETYLEIALTHGIDPELGFEMLLEHRGICDAITFLEQQAKFDTSVRHACITRLTEAMHAELYEALQRDLEKHEGKRIPDLALVDILNGRRWLFRNNRCHVDDSHLQAVVRFAVVLEDVSALERAIELCVYGMHLPASYQRQEACPFEDFYNDYRLLLGALANHDVDHAITHYETKLSRQVEENPRAVQFPAEVVAFIQHRTGHSDRAIATFVEHLSQCPRLTLCPPLIDLCRECGDFESFLSTAIEKNNALQYTIGLIEKYDLKPSGDGR